MVDEFAELASCAAVTAIHTAMGAIEYCAPLLLRIGR